MLASKEIASVFNVGETYLTILFGLCYRVRLDNIDHSKNQVSCFFLDEGDHRWLDMNDIYNCRSEFMKYPPQAIRFALYGLEDFHFPIDNAIARKHLENSFLNQSLTGRIFTKKEDFMLNRESKASLAIQVVFYHTGNSDNVYVNLNPKLLKQIYDDIPVPELVPVKLTAVNTSHVADNGDIFCQLQTNSVHHVNKLIKQFVRQTLNNPFLPLEKTVTISNESLFVVLDEQTNFWYRAKIVEDLKETKRMFFIDCGKIKTIRSSNMYCVESLHQELFKFPPQAIRTRLSGMGNEMPNGFVSRLRLHFGVNNNAYVRKIFLFLC